MYVWLLVDCYISDTVLSVLRLVSSLVFDEMESNFGERTVGTYACGSIRYKSSEIFSVLLGER